MRCVFARLRGVYPALCCGASADSKQKNFLARNFFFQKEKKIVRVKNEDGKIKEVWTGNYIFENEWQSFRTKKDRSIQLKSVSHECSPCEIRQSRSGAISQGRKGRRKIAVKVVDIFGNDTMKVIEVNI